MGMGFLGWVITHEFGFFGWEERNERGFEAGIYLSALSICMDGVFDLMEDGMGC